MKFQYNFNTNIGLKRQQNQDSGFVLPDHGLFLLADGMGGHSGGEIASKLVVQCVSEYFTNTINEKQDLPDMMNPNELVQNSIRAANLAIYQRSTEDIELQGMGTTTVMLLFNNQKLIIGNVGDSRCYFFRPQCIWQLTKDHSLVQEKLRAGLITREQLRTDKSKNVITRSVGFEPHLMVDLYETNVSVGDVFLICTDGLSAQVEDSQILEIVQKDLFEEDNLDKANQSLIDIANAHGGEDNVSVILIKVLGYEH